MDIRTKLVLALVMSALLSMALFGYLTYLLSFDLFLRNLNSQLAAVASSKAMQFDHLIDDWRADVERLARGDGLGNALAIMQQSPGGTEPGVSISLSDIAPRANPALRWVSAYDANGKRLLTTYPELVPMMVPDPEEEVRFVGARQMPGDGVGILIAVSLNPGVVVVGFDAGALRDITSDRTGLGGTGRSLLVAPSWFGVGGEPVDGYLIVNPPEETAPDLVSGALTEAPVVVAAALAAEDAEFEDTEYRGTPVIASTRALQAVGWRMVVQIDASEEVARVDELLRQMRDLGLSLGALVIFGGIVFGVYLSRRIRNLAETVERIRHGELDLRAEVEGADEVALLARSFNEFINQLDRSSDMFQLGALRVLVVEDSADSRYLLNELLTNWRMRAVIVEDEDTALQAIQEAEEDQEPIQLLLLDGNISKMESATLGDRLAALKDISQCPIIMLADNLSSADTERLKQLGVGHVVPKPVVASDLMEAILEEMGVSATAMGSMSDVFLTPMAPRSILLAEDSSIIQRVTVGFLEKWGHRVTIAGNGRLAVEACRGGDFDLILMDLEMPEMNGLEAALQIREEEKKRERRTPIIALTARATRQAREECMAAGMDDYISKPVDPKVLYRLIDAYPATTIPDTAPLSEDKPVGAVTEDPVQTADQEGLIDWRVARSLTGGDENLLDELIELFPVESGKHLDAIRAGIETCDAQQLARGAHSLKSAAGFFGAATLVACALEVENLGNASKIAEAAGQLPELETQTAQLIAAFKQIRPPA